MPELPEAERARQTLESALGRTIVAVDDRDSYVCRPHAPGEIAAALTGHTLATAHRRGKFMWLETDDGPGPRPAPGHGRPDRGRSRRHHALGPLHARVRRWRPARPARQAPARPRRAQPGLLARGTGRRRGRAGPSSAAGSAPAATPIKARLLDQHAISGIGNLLADQILWQARISPLHRTADLSTDDLDRLRREVRAAVRSAIRKGGAHTGRFIEARRRGGLCPRDGHHLERDQVGGRTTYWCPVCQT